MPLKRRTRGKERIIRTLLNHPDGDLTKYRISKLSECPWSSTHRILGELEDARLVSDTRVSSIRDLVMAWKDWKVKYEYQEYLVRDPLAFLRKQKAAKGSLKYALTTYQGENLIQNYLFPSRVDLYIRQNEKRKWHDMLVQAEALVGKGNIRLLSAPDEHIFYNSRIIGKLSVVSTPQLIVDLLREGGVCIEAANNLLNKVVGRNTIRKLRD